MLFRSTAKSTEAAQQVVAKTAELEKLKANPAADKAQIAQLETQKAELRRTELKAIEWKPLWGKPAIFAAAILLIFLLLFKDKAAPQREA